MDKYKYCVLDVFSEERYKGNPLSVVFTEGDLELEIYENLSREFGYAETSFIYYSEKENALKVRSFTPSGFEVSGAGHNLLGAVCAAILFKMDVFRKQGTEKFVFMKDKAVNLSVSSTKHGKPYLSMMQKSAQIGINVELDSVSKSLGIKTEAILGGNSLPVIVSTEVAHLMVGVNSVESLNMIHPNKVHLSKMAEKYKFQGVYCYAFLNSNPNIVQTRFFNPGIGIDEDAATGSAAGPLAGLLFTNNFIEKNKKYQLIQGVKMKQPSTIIFEVKDNGILISGAAVIVMEGTIHI